MMLKCTATGRQFGDKRDPAFTATSVAGVSCVIEEVDIWEGPTKPSGKGQYYRATYLRTASPVRDERFTKGACHD